MVALRGFRWYEAVPEAVLGVGLLWFLVDETDAATSAFKSPRALALMAAAAIGWLVARLVLARVVRRAAARALLLSVAAFAVLAVVVLPAYDDDVVVEAFPATVSAPSPPPPMPVETSPTPPPSGPVRLRTGSFRGIDHEASGTVNLYRRPDGRHVVGLEDFDIQPGPDYDVYIVPGADRRDRAGGTRLDDLRGNRGTQFYDLPAELTVGDEPWTVLIWCQTFGVPVAHATPA
jgi:Electron transfer DM13